MTFSAYPTYRDSGAAWIGRVPAPWGVRRLRFLADIRPSGVDKHSLEGELPVWLCNYVDVYKNNRITDALALMEATATPAEVERFSLRAGDVLITKDSETPDDIAAAALVEASGAGAVCGYHVALLRPVRGTINGAFLFWAFKAADTLAQCSMRAQGITRFGLSAGAIADLLLTVPPAADQRAITTFLDRECGKIDALVAEQERLIALLKEKRQAVISHAVTKGLDPNAPMKDSGVDWLGQVPAHWKVLRLGSLFTEVADEGEHDLPVLSVSIRSGVSDEELGDEQLERKVTRSEDRTKYKKVEPGDLVYNMMRAWQGGFGTVSVTGMVSPAYVVARPLGATQTQFIELLLRSPQGVEEVRRHSRGVTDFRLRLYWDEFKQLVVAMPLLPEQEAILAAVSAEVSRVDGLAAESERAIALLRERRAALISAAVTGEIDFRDVATPAEAEAA
jgi:type I restriction enzyme S subunit